MKLTSTYPQVSYCHGTDVGAPIHVELGKVVARVGQQKDALVGQIVDARYRQEVEVT